MKRSRNTCITTSGTMMQQAAVGTANEGSADESSMQPRRSRRLASKREAAVAVAVAGAAAAVASHGNAALDAAGGSTTDRLSSLPSSANVVVMWEPRADSATAEAQQDAVPPASASTVAAPGPAATAAQTPNADDAAALRSGLLQSVSLDGGLVITQAAAQQETDACGLWGLLPDELLEVILRQCTPAQLAQLESTCHFFHDSKLIEKIAKHKLKGVPRARGLRPNRREGETYTMLLHYVNCQSAAAAQATSVACGAYHTAALLIPADDGVTADASCSSSLSSSSSPPPQRHSLYTFGRGFHGQLGNDSHDSQREPTHISLGFKPCQDNLDLEEETMPAVVACGAHHSTAISRKGELYAWGLGCHGELGLGRWGPIELPLPRQCSSPSVRIVSVACGANHTLAIAESGTLWSCGKNRHGQLGNTTMVDSSRLQMVMHLSGYRIVSSAAGSAHSMALASDGSLFTWGDGSRGQLGHSQLQSLAAMMPANNPITMPTAQKITRLDPISLSPEHRVTAIAAGAFFSMALTVGGSILAFGANDQGQLGVGDNADRWKPTRINLAAHRALQQQQRGYQLMSVGGGNKGGAADDDEGGGGSFGVVDGDGGDDWQQKGGKELLSTQGEHIGSMAAAATAPTSSGDSDSHGQCLRVVQLACGQAHSIALLSCQGRLQVRTTGANTNGQLGHGDRTSRCVFTPLPRLPNIVAVQAGDEHSGAVSASGELFLWGRGDCGQLGLGDGRAKWKPTALRGFRVVHPDKTLRRNKRNQPYTRAATGDARLAAHGHTAPFM